MILFFTALAGWIADALILDRPLVAVWGLSGSLLVCVGCAMALLWGGSWKWIRASFVSTFVWMMVIGAVWATRSANAWIAEQRLREVVAALELYRVQTGTYPESLSQLAPRYFASVPVAKYTFRNSKIHYHCPQCRIKPSEAIPEAISVILNSPHEQKLYDFKRKSWAYTH